MLRTFNYTERTDIDRADVDVRVREVSGASPVATISVRLDGYDLPADAEVFAEAYRKASYMRKSLGTVGGLAGETDFELREFDTPDGVRFRIKVTGRRKELEQAPVLLAVADGVDPVEGDEDHDLEKLLNLQPADLNGEVWRVDTSDGPTLLIERSLWQDRLFVRAGWCFPLVLPQVLREVLRAALSNKYRETDEDVWQSRWLVFALGLPGGSELPKANAEQDVIEEWIHEKAAAFGRKQKILDRIAPHVEGAE